ncbi:hypothetical protein PFISCL1PPCAC_20837, partial [Pristionchus fissidentatus]
RGSIKMAKDNADNKIMAEKVSKVREVISNVSKNDIILALHSHDLDVARTIAALMDGGALDEWECAGGSAGKNKKKANNNSKKPVEAPKSEAPAAKPAVVSAPSAPIAPSVPLTSQVKKAPVANGINGSEKKNADVSSIDGALSRQTQFVSQWQKECSAGKQNIIATMKSLRAVVEERENMLLAELARQEASSSRLFANHKQTIETLRAKAASGKDVTVELKAIAKQEEDLLKSDVFSYDMTSIVNQISSFGRIFSTGVLPTASASASAVSASPISPPPMKHSGSRSSLVSSVGDDSGLGQGSPVPPEKVAKPVSGGAGPIQVASADGFSADQLAAIQKQVQDSLAASGISTDILMGVSAGAEVIRRPNKPKGPKGAERKNNNNGAAKKNGSNLQLSIFN